MKCPTLSEVSAYWNEKNLHGDPEEFFDHFEERGWIPKGYTSMMKNWQAAARNWSRNEYRFKRAGNVIASYPSKAEIERFNKLLVGLSAEAYRSAFHARFGFDPKETTQ